MTGDVQPRIVYLPIAKVHNKIKHAMEELIEQKPTLSEIEQQQQLHKILTVQQQLRQLQLQLQRRQN